MQISVTHEQDVAHIALEGLLNTNTAGSLELAVEEAFKTATSACFDMSQLDYISSAGLRVLVGAQKAVTAAGGHLRIVGASDDIREVFDITGLIDIFDVA